MDLQKLIFDRTTPEPNTGCWLWTRAYDGPGYGRLLVGGRKTGAHRLSYEAFVGSIGPGLQVDHLCRNRACVNPSHLEVVTSRINTLRGQGPSAQHARKATCRRGHPYSGANLRVWAGRRYCHACSLNRK